MEIYVLNKIHDNNVHCASINSKLYENSRILDINIFSLNFLELYLLKTKFQNFVKLV